ncbi:MAG: hypothetical protein U0176_20710 [Bacteroidia bacterium]
MKRLILPCLGFLMLASCKEANKINISENEICITDPVGNISCEKMRGPMARIYVQDGKLVCTPLQGKSRDSKKFAEFGEVKTLSSTKLDWKIAEDKLVLTDAQTQISSLGSLGILVSYDGGKILCMTDKVNAINATSIEFPWPTKASERCTTYRSTLYTALERDGMKYVFQANAHLDEAGQFIPNDTGTVVIIVDNFRTGDCNIIAPDNCCPSMVPLSPLPGDTTGWAANYATQGRRILACYPVGSICTFVDGDQLIIYHCTTMTRKCWDLSVCPISIDKHCNDVLAFNVMNDCTAPSPF